MEMRAQLKIWDDDESDELFYMDCVCRCARRLATEEAADNEMHTYEAREAENLHCESEAFLARQMDETQALAACMYALP
jgi:RNA-binding protein 25